MIPPKQQYELIVQQKSRFLGFLKDFNELLSGKSAEISSKHKRINDLQKKAKHLFESYEKMMSSSDLDIILSSNNERIDIKNDSAYIYGKDTEKEKIKNRSLSESEYWSIIFNRKEHDNRKEHEKTFWITIGKKLNIIGSNTDNSWFWLDNFAGGNEDVIEIDPDKILEEFYNSEDEIEFDTFNRLSNIDKIESLSEYIVKYSQQHPSHFWSTCEDIIKSIGYIDIASDYWNLNNIKGNKMALVFQYGSNMDVTRLNSREKLNGNAIAKGSAVTVDKYDIVFNVWSDKNNCAATNMQIHGHTNIWGILFEIPSEFIYRRKDKIKTLDAIEGEGSNYERKEIEVIYQSERVTALTYVGKKTVEGIKTSFDYVQHLVKGAVDNNLNNEYVNYIISQIVKNNPDLSEQVKEYYEIQIKEAALKKCS